uniref:Replication enhancer n=1 Tax=Beet curly top virus TaxID=10840 RepID=A0A125RA01_9GEMI|nr:replication enhancer protein [Beet curly top virus]
MNAIRDFRTRDPITVQQASITVQVVSVPNPLYIKVLWFQRYGPVYHTKVQIRFNLSLRRFLNIHKCWIDLTITGSHRTLTGDRFLRVLKRQLQLAIARRETISINIVVNILEYILYDVFNFVSSVIQDTSIAMNLY